MNRRLLLVSLLTGALAFGNALRAQTTTAVPLVQVLATDPTALNGTSSGSFTLIRDGDTNEDLTVVVEMSGTASNGVDYVLIAENIIIPTGWLAVDVPVQPVLDPDNRGNKTVILTIETNSSYRLDRKQKALVTIVDDVFNNPLPVVAITEPTNGSTFGYPTGIPISVDASDAGTNILSVSFYADDEFLGRVTNAPYTLTWTGAKLGHHTLFARTVDDLYQSAVSAAVQITVTDVLPVVTLATPLNGANFAAHQNIPIAATVTDADPSATISSVAFYSNGQFLGSSTTAPYQFVWSNAPVGSYLLEAAATDNSGQKGYSKLIKISVSKSGH